MYGIECTVPMVEPGHMVYGVRTWLNCFVRSPEIRGTFISFSIRVQFSVSVPFFFFPPLVQSRQFRNSYWPAYQNSPSGNFRYWLLRINVFYFIYYHFIFSRWTQDDQRRTLARFGAFVCQERGGRRLINEQLTVSLVSVVRDSTIAR